MFSAGEYVVYGQSGVMLIVDIREESVFGEKKCYYVMRPFDAPSDALTFVPCDNEKLTAKIRPIMTESEATSVIKEARLLPDGEWAEDSRVRALSFKKILSDGSPAKILKMITTIKRKIKEGREQGRKSYLSDEVVMKKAERLIYSELSLALGIGYEKLDEYIENATEGV